MVWDMRSLPYVEDGTRFILAVRNGKTQFFGCHQPRRGSAFEASGRHGSQEVATTDQRRVSTLPFHGEIAPLCCQSVPPGTKFCQNKSCARLPRCEASSIQEQFVATIMVLLPEQQASHTVVHVLALRRMAVFRMWKEAWRWSTSCIKCFGSIELSSSGVQSCPVLKPWRKSSMLLC